MTSRRPLADTLIDVALGTLEAVAPMYENVPSLTAREIAVSLPIEFAVRRAAGEWHLLGDVPRTVTRTAFDQPPGRLEIIWTARADAAAESSDTADGGVA